jgi:hypothetical protein
VFDNGTTLVLGGLALLLFGGRKSSSSTPTGEVSDAELEAIAKAAERVEKENTPPAPTPPAKPSKPPATLPPTVFVNSPTGLPPTSSTPKPTPATKPAPATPAAKPKPVPVKPPAKPTPPPPAPKAAPKPKPKPAPKPKEKKAPKPAPTVKDKPPVTLAQEIQGPPAPITNKTTPKEAAGNLAQYARLGGALGVRGAPAPYVEQAQKAMGMRPIEVDGIYGPNTQAFGTKLGIKMPTRVRSPLEAAQALSRLINERQPLGTKAKPSDLVRAAQRDMKMAQTDQDGIYGPRTQARARELGVKLPTRK